MSNAPLRPDDIERLHLALTELQEAQDPFLGAVEFLAFIDGFDEQWKQAGEVSRAIKAIEQSIEERLATSNRRAA